MTFHDFDEGRFQAELGGTIPVKLRETLADGSFRRRVLTPDSSLDGLPDALVDACAAHWTPDRVAEWRAALPDSTPAPLAQAKADPHVDPKAVHGLQSLLLDLADRIASSLLAWRARHPDQPSAARRCRQLPSPALIAALWSMRKRAAALVTGDRKRKRRATCCRRHVSAFGLSRPSTAETDGSTQFGTSTGSAPSKDCCRD